MDKSNSGVTGNKKTTKEEREEEILGRKRQIIKRKALLADVEKRRGEGCRVD